MLMKGMLRLLLAPLFTVPAFVWAQTLDEYLALRKEHKISQASSSAALQTFVGERVMEVKGVAKGAIGAILILDNPQGDELYVRSEHIPDWIKTGSQEVRLIVKAVRAHEASLITAELLAAIAEPVIGKWEDGERAKRAVRATTPRPRSAPTTSRGAGTSVSRGTVNVITGSRGGQGRVLSPEVQSLIPVYTDFIQGQNRRLSRNSAWKIAETILEFSVHFGVDARLIVALVLTESAFNPSAVSRAGARGLGQLMPGTARMLGVSNSFNADQNLYGTTKLLRQHLDKYTSRTGDSFEGLILALAAYNAGPGAVKRHGGVPPYRETQAYVRKVVETYRRLIGE
jgi:hypothetical protein